MAARAIWVGTARWYLHGWGSRHHWRQKLDELANGATDEYMKDLMGTPVFRERKHATDDSSESPVTWVDHTYSTPHAWVVTRSIEERVVSWSVTITDPKFWWGLKVTTFGQNDVRLGRVTFTDAVPQSTGQLVVIGASNYVHAESTSYGNPGGYQNFLYVYDQEGIGSCKYVSREDDQISNGDFCKYTDRPKWNRPVPADVRAGTTVNTLVVTMYDDSPSRLVWQDWPVAYREKMRLLHHYQKRRGWRGRR
ncbi:hypothetical protein QO003_001825 [Arthrobacter silviterrae]|uniref:Uncharacterized protein n=1 Tax=Arthrobacter silviterrae TaxID=2026658 RepID=A0ABX0DHX9_9MICC|nr:ETEC_3214 domain-containing protein [Arthrobacter silviterrae]MDQ0277522.1 hypothetical protein [Arthrobacter silviterrae]NGN85356.1 hypothetical protein [Arthrobacter silviterrae]